MELKALNLAETTLSITDLIQPTEKSPLKYKGLLRLNNGVEAVVYFSPRVTGDHKGSFIAPMPSAITKFGTAINKSYPVATLADALKNKTILSLNLTPKATADPSKPKATRSRKASEQPLETRAVLATKDGKAYVLITAGGVTEEIQLVDADYELVKTFENCLLATRYYLANRMTLSASNRTAELAKLEAMKQYLPEEAYTAAKASILAKYAMPTIAEASAKQAEADAKRQADALKALTEEKTEQE